MSRIVSFVLLGGLILVAAAAIEVNDVEARQQTDFIQISVLAEGQANYAVDENLVTIPAVSMAIIADKVQDSQRQSLVPVITYTSLPTKEPRPTRQDVEEAASVNEVKLDENPGNNDNPNQNGGNGNADNAGNNKDKEDKPDKDKGNSNGDNGNGGGNSKDDKPDKDKGDNNGGNGNGGGNDGNKDSEQEPKPDKEK